MCQTTTSMTLLNCTKNKKCGRRLINVILKVCYGNQSGNLSDDYVRSSRGGFVLSGEWSISKT